MELTPDEIRASLEEIEALFKVNVWLQRGDGVAVYENVDLGHPNVGHRQYVSFGGPAAQLVAENPPERLPDIGGALNWRYWLIGKYKGEPFTKGEPSTP